MRAGHMISTQNWTPKDIDLTPVESFVQKIPPDGDVAPYEAYKLALKSARLLDYLVGIRAKVELFYLRSRSQYRQTFEMKSVEYNDKSVADGERRAHKDEEVSKLREQRDYAEAYLVLIQEKMASLEKLHYLLKQRHQEAEREEGRSGYG